VREGEECCDCEQKEFQDSYSHAPSGRGTGTNLTDFGISHASCHSGEASQPEDRGSELGEQHAVGMSEDLKVARRHNRVWDGDQLGEYGREDEENHRGGNMDRGRKMGVEDVCHVGSKHHADEGQNELQKANDEDRIDRHVDHNDIEDVLESI